MSKLIEENATLQEKLDESEILRKKFMEKNQQLEKQIKQEQNDRRELEEKIGALNKRVKDLNALKSTGHKVLEDKINKLSQENETLKRENDGFKKQKKSAKG